jgi:hypothetical protein
VPDTPTCPNEYGAACSLGGGDELGQVEQAQPGAIALPTCDLGSAAGPILGYRGGEYRGSRSGPTELRSWGAEPLVGVKRFYR